MSDALHVENNLSTTDYDLTVKRNVVYRTAICCSEARARCFSGTFSVYISFCYT